MHPLSLQLKRAHLKSVAFGKQIVERVTDMTPAGFDILYCIRTDFGNRPIPKGQYDYGHGGVLQRDLWKRLRLHHSTISKALTRLRDLGWVESGVDRNDARMNFVRLTDTGKRRIERAMRIVFQQHSHLKKFEGFFKKRRPRNVVKTI